MAKTMLPKTQRQRELELATGQPIEAVLRDALRAAGRGGIRVAARRLAIAHTTLIAWLGQYDIDPQVEMAKGILGERG